MSLSNVDIVKWNNKIKSLLSAVGIPAAILPYSIAQTFFETGGFSSPLATHYNYSGIMYTPGTGKTKGKNGFAWYDNADHWANDYKRVISLNLSGNGRPIDAGDGVDFFTKLKANKYFGAPLNTYINGVNQWVGKINDALKFAGILAAPNFVDNLKKSIPGSTDTPNAGQMQAALTYGVVPTGGGNKALDTASGWWAKLPFIAKAGIVAGGIVVAIRIIDR